MFTTYIVVTTLAAAANIFSATLDFIRYKPILINMANVSVSESWIADRHPRACGWNRRRRRPRPVFYRRYHHSLARARLLVRPRDRVPSPGNRHAADATGFELKKVI